MTAVLVFNPTEQSIRTTDAGHVVEPHGWGVADEEFSAEDIRSGRLVIQDYTGQNEGNLNPAVIMAKRELEERLRLSKPVPEPAVVAAEEEAPPATDDEPVKE